MPSFRSSPPRTTREARGSGSARSLAADTPWLTVVLLVVLALLASALVAPPLAGADDKVGPHSGPGEEAGLPGPAGGGHGAEGEPIALEDLFSSGWLADDSPVSPRLAVTTPTNWPSGLSTGTAPAGQPEVTVYLPTEAHLDVPWYELTTRAGTHPGTGAEIIVPPSGIVLRRNHPLAPGVYRAYYTLPDAPTRLTLLSQHDPFRLHSLPSAETQETVFPLGTDFTARDLLQAGVPVTTSGGVRQQTILMFGHQTPVRSEVVEHPFGRYWRLNFLHDTFDPHNPPPAVTTQPADVDVFEGEDARFSGAATSASATQWQMSTNGGSSWANVAGATSPTLDVTSTTLAMDGRLYRLRFTNSSGSVESRAARLTVRPRPAAPAVVEHPTDVAVGAPRGAEFSAAAESTIDMTVRWQVAADAAAAAREDWADVEGATTQRHEIAETTPEMDGSLYRAVFTNASGSVATDAATLSVWVAPGARLAVTPRAVLVPSLDTGTHPR